MRKGIFLVLLFVMTILTSCTKESSDDVYQEFVDSVSNASSYVLSAEMEVQKAEGSNIFEIEVSYKNPNYYKVNYQNKSSNSRQILLKNDDGVYVLSPELNKEFKFDSTWPLNSSHIYILNKVVDDLAKDSERATIVDDNYYIFTSTISHKVKKDLVKQAIYVNKQTKKLEKIAYQSDSKDVMTLAIKSLEFDKTLSSDTFNLDAIMKSETSSLGEGSVVEVSSVSFENVFEASCTSETTENITVMSYKGEKNYSIIFQKLEDSPSDSARIYDDFIMLDDTMGFIGANSLTFYLSNYEFKIVSAALSVDEMVLVANSLVLA